VTTPPNALPPLPETVRASFLESLGVTGEVRTAAAISGLSRSAAYARRRADPAFAAAWDAAIGRHDERHHRVIDAAATDGEKPDWKAAAWKLEWRERQRKGALERAKLRAEIEYLTLRNNGTLPADNVNVHVDPSDLFAQLQAVRARRGRGPDGGGAGGAAGGDAGGAGPAGG
jgi:hypothetical protein